jgi:hypothetical protein
VRAEEEEEEEEDCTAMRSLQATAMLQPTAINAVCCTLAA